MENKLFNTTQFWLWILNGIWHAIIVTYGSVYPIEESFIDSGESRQGYFYASGMMMFTNIIKIFKINILILNISDLKL